MFQKPEQVSLLKPRDETTDAVKSNSMRLYSYAFEGSTTSCVGAIRGRSVPAGTLHALPAVTTIANYRHTIVTTHDSCCKRFCHLVAMFSDQTCMISHDDNTVPEIIKILTVLAVELMEEC